MDMKFNWLNWDELEEGTQYFQKPKYERLPQSNSLWSVDYNQILYYCIHGKFERVEYCGCEAGQCDYHDYKYFNLLGLEGLGKSKNDGRGISCLKTLIHYLKRGDLDTALQVTRNESDKLRSYDDIWNAIVLFFGEEYI